MSETSKLVPSVSSAVVAIDFGTKGSGYAWVIVDTESCEGE